MITEGTEIKPLFNDGDVADALHNLVERYGGDINDVADKLSVKKGIGECTTIERIADKCNSNGFTGELVLDLEMKAIRSRA